MQQNVSEIYDTDLYIRKQKMATNTHSFNNAVQSYTDYPRTMYVCMLQTQSINMCIFQAKLKVKNKFICVHVLFKQFQRHKQKKSNKNT